MNRLKLIWYALTAPLPAVEHQVDVMEFAIEEALIRNTQQALDRIRPGTWKLTGIRLEHSGSVDVSAIEDFLVSAPATIQALLKVVHPAHIEDMEGSLSAIGDVLASLPTMDATEREFAINVQLPDLVGDYMPQVRKRFDDIPF